MQHHTAPGPSSAPLTRHPDYQNHPAPPPFPPILLLLVGLPGSGKTTFSNSLISHYPYWIRASQDEAPGRRRQICEGIVRDGLRRGSSVVVDRVGFDAAQRAHFIRIANTFDPRPHVQCLVLEVSQATLEQRLIDRPTHPTIPDADTGLRVLAQMMDVWSPPVLGGNEGIDRVLTLKETDQPEDAVWGLEEVTEVLRRIAEDK